MLRKVNCYGCGETVEARFPFGYRDTGIDSCPNCGHRDFDITLVKE